MAVTDQQFLDHANENSQEFSNRQILLKGEISPPNLPAPIGSFYKNTVNGDRYEKIGPANTDWELFGSGGSNQLIDIRPCDETLTINSLVWESIDIPGNVEQAINNTDIRRIIGICIDKPSSTMAEILLAGKSGGFEGLLPGLKIYCSTDGEVTSILPETGYIQVLGDAISSTEIDFSPSHQRILRA